MVGDVIAVVCCSSDCIIGDDIVQVLIGVRLPGMVARGPAA
jgi:hypothetical protein